MSLFSPNSHQLTRAASTPLLSNASPQVLLSAVSAFGGGDVQGIIDSWRNCEETSNAPLRSQQSRPCHGDQALANRKPSFLYLFLRHVYLHVKWQAYLSVSDPILYLTRVGSFTLASVVFALVYWDARERTQEQVVNRLFLSAWFVAMPTCMSVIAVYALNDEWLQVRRE